jgi:hypothetical protein
LVEPVQGLVVAVAAPAVESKPPQGLGRHVTLGVKIGEVAQQLLGLGVLAVVGVDLGLS